MKVCFRYSIGWRKPVNVVDWSFGRWSYDQFYSCFGLGFFRHAFLFAFVLILLLFIILNGCSPRQDIGPRFGTLAGCRQAGPEIIHEQDGLGLCATTFGYLGVMLRSGSTLHLF